MSNSAHPSRSTQHFPCLSTLKHQTSKSYLSVLHQDPEGHMLQAACYLDFFGFFRAAEFTTPSWEEIDQGILIIVADVAIVSHAHPSILQVHIK